MNDLPRRMYLCIFHWICPILLFLIGLLKTFQWLVVRYHLEKMENFYYRKLDQIDDKWVHLTWVLVVGLAILVLFLEIRRFFTRTILNLKTQGGRPLKVRQIAVNRYVRSSLLSQPFVKDVRVEARSSGGGLVLKLRVWLAATDNIDNLQEEILRRVVEETQKSFGITKVHDPEILIESVKTNRTKDPKTPLTESYDSDTSNKSKERTEPEEPVSLYSAPTQGTQEEVEVSDPEPKDDTSRASYTGYFDSVESADAESDDSKSGDAENDSESDDAEKKSE